MNNEEKLEKIKEFIKENMTTEFYETHNYLHGLRVLEKSRKIIKLEKNAETLNKLVIETASLVHDFVDHKFCDNIPEQEEKLRNILKENEYSSNDIEDIIYIINNISYSKGVIPESREGKIVQDADRLDALLAFSIVRPFTYSVKVNRLLYNGETSALGHYIEKKLKLEKLLNTEGAKKIAAEKAEITYIYLAYLLDELPDDIYEKEAYKEELKEFYIEHKDVIPKKLIPKEYCL